MADNVESKLMSQKQANVIVLGEFLKKISIIAGIANNINNVNFQSGSIYKKFIFHDGSTEAELNTLKRNVHENYHHLQELDGMIRTLMNALNTNQENILGEGQTFQSYFTMILSKWSGVKNMLSVWVDELNRQEDIVIQIEKKEENEFKQIFELGKKLPKSTVVKYNQWLNEYLVSSNDEIILYNRMYFFKHLVQIITNLENKIAVTNFNKSFSPKNYIKSYDSKTPLTEQEQATYFRSLEVEIETNYIKVSGQKTRQSNSNQNQSSPNVAVGTAGLNSSSQTQTSNPNDWPGSMRINPERDNMTQEQRITFERDKFISILKSLSGPIEGLSKDKRGLFDAWSDSALNKIDGNKEYSNKDYEEIIRKTFIQINNR